MPCDQNANTCTIRVPAPGVALVFFSDAAQQQAGATPSVETFSTTVFTNTKNTVSIDPSVLATAQGMSGKDRTKQGGTSQGGVNGAISMGVPWALVVTGALVGFSLCTWRLL